MENKIVNYKPSELKNKNKNLSVLQKWFSEKGVMYSQNYKINNDEYKYVCHWEHPKEHYEYNISITIKNDILSIISDNKEVWSIKLNAENSIFNIYKHDSASYQIYDICTHIVHFTIICKQNKISSEEQKAFNEFIKNLFENIFQNTSINADEFFSLTFNSWGQNDDYFYISFNLENINDNNKSFITLETENKRVHGINFKDFLLKIPQFNTYNQNLDSISEHKIFTLLARSFFDYNTLDKNAILKDLQDKENNLRRKQNCESIINSTIKSFNRLIDHDDGPQDLTILKLVSLELLDNNVKYEFTYKLNNEEYRLQIQDKYFIDEEKKESEITIIEEKDCHSYTLNNKFQKTVEKKIDFNISWTNDGFGIFDHDDRFNVASLSFGKKCNTLICEYLLNKKFNENSLTIKQDVKMKIINVLMKLQENINWNTNTEDKTSIITIQFNSPLIKSNTYSLEIDLKNFTIDNPKIALYKNNTEKLKDLDFEGLSQIVMKEKSISSDDLIDYFDIEEEKECKKSLQKEILYKKKKENIGIIIMISIVLCYAVACCTYVTELLSGCAFAGLTLISATLGAMGSCLFSSPQNAIQPNTSKLF